MSVSQDSTRRPRQVSQNEQVLRTRAWTEVSDEIRLMKASILEKFPSMRDIEATYFIATLVIENNLGTSWLNDHVLTGSPRRRDDYLRSGAMVRQEKYEHVHRVHELARRILELGQEDFAPQLLDSLRTRDLLGAAFEADVVRMLISGPFIVDLRNARGVLGDDYDIDLWLTPERPWAIEVKTKNEDEPWRPGKLGSTMKRARKQLPAKGAGGIFIRVPRSWMADDLYRQACIEELKSSLRNTSRVQAVVLVWEEWRDNSIGGRTPVRRHKIIRQNPLNATVEGLLAFFDAAWNFDWDIGPTAPF